jgi:hypothetical protein
MAHRRVVETALGRGIPEDLEDRTRDLEGVIVQMRLVRLTPVDRAVLSSIGNLLVDSAIRKGRPITERIPPAEVVALRDRALRYMKYAHGKL